MNQGITFVHAADLHLGATFSGLTSLSETTGSQLVDAVVEAYRRVIDICLTRSVDFLVLAGDSFNKDEVPYRVQRVFFEGLYRLKDAGIEVFLSMGNHDPMSSWGRRLSLLPENVRVFDSRHPSYYVFEKGGYLRAGLVGRSFDTAIEKGDLTGGLTRSDLEQQVGQTTFSIGVLHTGITDEKYAPCSIETLKAAGFDYWALGHIHKRQVFPDVPAVMPGSPQGLDINENSEHGCYLVTLQEQVRPQIEFIQTSVIAWEHAKVDITGIDSPNELIDLLVSRGNELVQARGTSVCVRFHLVGRSQLYALLNDERDVDDVCEQVAERCSAGELWLRVDDIMSSVEPELDYDALAHEGLFPSVVMEQADKMMQDHDELADTILEQFSKHGIARYSKDLDYKEIVETARDMCLDKLMGDERS